jgi:KEOPS complex subunit Cgi121
MKPKHQEKEIAEYLAPEKDYQIRTAKVEIKDLNDFLSRIRDISNKLGTHIICLNADMIAGRVHAELAMKLAYRSFFRGKNPISNSFEMEVLLYAGGTRQCTDAGRFGIHEGFNSVYICICPKNDAAIELLEKLVTFTKNDSDLNNGKKSYRLASLFGISNDEIEAVGPDQLSDLVLERVALLDVNK